jgi:TRAP transporter 4TM/12TM fusion protein
MEQQTLSKPVKNIETILGVTMSIIIIIYSANIIRFDLMILNIILLTLVSLIGYLPRTFYQIEGKNKVSIINLLFMLGGVIPNIYLLFNLDHVYFLWGSIWTTADVIFGTMLILSILWLVKLYIGWTLSIVATLFILYTLFGFVLPNQLFGHPGVEYSRAISHYFGPNGIYGTVLNVFSTIIVIFVLFGTFLLNSGGATTLLDLAKSLTGRMRGGSAKVTVAGSAFMGSINGNPIANVATTGHLTIPLMKKQGFKSEFAGGVEAASSSGGVFLPPIMGATAFVMAEFLGVPYREVMIAAIIPAVLYYLGVFFLVDLRSHKMQIANLDEEEIPKFWDVLKSGWYHLLPIVTLIYMLLIVRSSIAQAGLIAIAVLFVISFFKKETRMNIPKLITTLSDSAKSTVSLGAIIAVAGIIIGSVGITGLGSRFGSVILSFAQENLYVAGILVAVLCIILGMGLPTIAAYVIAIAVAGSTLINLGVSPLTAHLFVFYFAALSGLTPPVALTAYTAATIAKSNMMKTSYIAFMLAIVGYIVPFIFLTSPELLMVGSASQIILASVTAITALMLAAMALEGISFIGRHFWYVWQRILFIISAMLLIVPGIFTDLIGLGIALLTIMVDKRIAKRVLNKKDGVKIEPLEKVK